MIAGLGIELVEVAAFEAHLQASGGPGEDPRFTRRELEYCLPKKRAAEHLAARLAAKLAALKAMGLQTPDAHLLHTIEVVRAASGQPALELAEPLKSMLHEREIGRLHLSISHSGGYAVGMVVVERRPGISPASADGVGEGPTQEESDEAL